MDYGKEMKAVDTQLLKLLQSSSQYVVPIYQRLYSWDPAECEQLWRDILRAGEHDNIGAHFTGSIVYVSKGASTNTASQPDLIIDGQQRTTTVSLILAALASQLGTLPEGDQEIHDGFSPKKIRDRYLMDPNEEGDRRFKLLLSQGDREHFKAVVQGHDVSGKDESRVVANYNYFVNQLKSKSTNLVTVCKGLEKLVVVDVELERGLDNPQLVFEAMNSTGKKLSQADLIRNFLLMDLDPVRQVDVYERFWRPMEMLFTETGEENFDAFVRHFLTIETGEIPRIGDVYDAFKSYAFGKAEAGQTVEELALALSGSAERYSRIALGRESDAQLRPVFSELEQIKADVVYPFVLRVYSDYDAGKLSQDDFVSIVRMVISYVFRRVVCRIPTNSMNKTFSGFASHIDVENYLASVTAHFLNLQSYRRFPTDEEFAEGLQTTDFYNFRRRSYLLRSLENVGRKEPVTIEEFTIEHILPQNPDLSAEWRESLGPEWADIQEKYLHTLGNLTLTGYNSEYSDHPFLKKRDMEGGFAVSPLKLNEGLGQLETWDETAIIARAKQLSKLALGIWTRPSLSTEQLAKYRKEESKSQDQYSFEVHEWLRFTPERSALFDRLDSAVLALNPVVRRQIMKLYIAYKAETNFVDVAPLKSKLNLSLNVPPGELVDPRGLAEDVSRVGRWGNGDYQVGLDESTDFDYVLGLVRQSFERQLEEES
jgi:uncharacterized protein with ParB-like and HNH nuclease domain/predicted transport protein